MIKHLNMVAHENNVFLCESRDGRNQILTSTLSLSQQVAPEQDGPWELVFSEDGFGALASTASDSYLLLEDLLDRHVYKSATGMLYITEYADREAKIKSPPWNLTERMTEYDARETVISDGDSDLKWPVFKLRFHENVNASTLVACQQFGGLYMLGLTMPTFCEGVHGTLSA